VPHGLVDLVVSSSMCVNLRYSFRFHAIVFRVSLSLKASANAFLSRKSFDRRHPRAVQLVLCRRK